MNASCAPALNVSRFMNGRQHPTLRYASYDHCFNYFQDLHETNQIRSAASAEKSQLSCLHLGYYLASWGMFRGKAALLQHSSRALLPAVQLIVRAPEVIWDTDVETYDDSRIQALLDFRDELREVVPGGRSGTLTSKIMLGVFGCVPAFDRFFCEGFGVSGFRRSALHEVRDYYNLHSAEIERCRPLTIGFNGETTNRKYSQAKIIDMIFFVEGQDMATRRNSQRTKNR